MRKGARFRSPFRDFPDGVQHRRRQHGSVRIRSEASAMQSATRHPVATYLVITYLLTGVVFVLPLLSRAGLGLLPIELPGVAPFILLSAFGLALLAFLATALADGRPGVRELASRARRFRVSPIWYLVAIVREPMLLVGWLAGLLLAALLVNYWEEVGWTGFVLHRLQPRIGPVAASVVTTWFQSALHLPLVFIAGGVTDGRVPPDEYPFYLVALFVLPIPVRIVLTWLYNRSGNSLPVVGIYHAGLGIASGSSFLPVIAPTVNPVFVYAGFGVLPLVVLVATRGRLGYPRGAEPAAPTGRPLVAEAS